MSLGGLPWKKGRIEYPKAAKIQSESGRSGLWIFACAFKKSAKSSQVFLSESLLRKLDAKSGERVYIYPLDSNQGTMLSFDYLTSVLSQGCGLNNIKIEDIVNIDMPSPQALRDQITQRTLGTRLNFRSAHREVAYRALIQGEVKNGLIGPSMPISKNPLWPSFDEEFRRYAQHMHEITEKERRSQRGRLLKMFRVIVLWPREEDNSDKKSDFLEELKTVVSCRKLDTWEQDEIIAVYLNRTHLRGSISRDIFSEIENLFGSFGLEDISDIIKGYLNVQPWLGLSQATDGSHIFTQVYSPILPMPELGWSEYEFLAFQTTIFLDLGRWATQDKKSQVLEDLSLFLSSCQNSCLPNVVIEGYNPRIHMPEEIRKLVLKPDITKDSSCHVILLEPPKAEEDRKSILQSKLLSASFMTTSLRRYRHSIPRL